MKIVFIGTVLFSERMLEKLISMNADVVGVITSESNTFNADYVDLKFICEQNNIPARTTNTINDEQTVAWVRKLVPDIIFCFGWSRLIKIDLLNIPKLGVVGFHPAALPKNRGRHPLIWALVLGLQETASTFFLMDEGADSGDIASQEYIQISPDDDASTLYQKVIEVAEKQLENLVTSFQDDSLVPKKQNLIEGNIWRKRGPTDGKIDWRMDSVTIQNLVRALTHPYIGAHFEWLGQEYKIWRAELVKISGTANLEPGKVIDIERGMLIVKCGNGVVKLVDVDPNVTISVGAYL